MDILLYNPLSRNGNNPKFIQKIAKHLEKQGKTVVKQDILDIEDVTDFISKLHPEDRVILVGGDGTLNHLVNRIYGIKYPQSLYMYQAGTGNDFIRSLKTKDKVVLIKPYLDKLPTITYQSITKRFVNGAGLGLDGFVIHLVSNSKYKKNKINYFRHSLEGFRKFKSVSGTFTVDGKTYTEKKIWFASALNAPYQGGGMKMAPQADRNDGYLDLLVIKNMPKLLLFVIFPTIYFGIHPCFKKYVKIYRGKHITVHVDRPTYIQVDGESKSEITDIELFAAK